MLGFPNQVLLSVGYEAPVVNRCFEVAISVKRQEDQAAAASREREKVSRIGTFLRYIGIAVLIAVSRENTPCPWMWCKRRVVGADPRSFGDRALGWARGALYRVRGDPAVLRP